MKVVLTGEGPTDLGSCTNSLGQCNCEDFRLGPMAVLLSQAVEPLLGYDLVTFPDSFSYLSETFLSTLARSQRRRLLPTRSKRHKVETGYFFASAMAFGQYINKLEIELNEPVMGVLFRDSDGTRTSPSTLWVDKLQSMRDGFSHVSCKAGVPMVPKPKSEVWLLCAAQPGLQNCAGLEEISGNDKSPNSAKKQLDNVFGNHKSGEELCDWLTTQPPELVRMRTLPSYAAFIEDLDLALSHVLR